MPTSGALLGSWTAVLAHFLLLFLCQLSPTIAAEGPKPLASSWRLECGDGSLLPGTPTVGPEESEAWQLPSGVLLPLDSLWITRIGRGRLPLPMATAEDDWLMLHTTSGGIDRRRGWFLGWNAVGLLFEGPTGERRHPWRNVSGVLPLAERREFSLETSPVHLVFRSGGHVSATILQKKENRIHVKLPWGKSVWLNDDDLSAVHPRTPRLRWQPVPSDPKDWLSGLPNQPQENRSVEGRALRVGGKEYPVGWGLRAPSALRLQVAAAGVLRFWVGVDDEVRAARRHASLRFVVLWQDRELARSPRLRVGNPAQEMVLKIPDSGVITVRLEAIERPPFAAHGDLLMPRFFPQGN